MFHFTPTRNGWLWFSCTKLSQDVNFPQSTSPVPMSRRLLQLSQQEWHAKAQAANYSVRRLAELCGVSLRTLERHFDKVLGKSPQVWLDEARMAVARELLVDGSSVKETAALSGFKTQQHFSRMFRKYHGYPPKQHWQLLEAKQ